ncbi:hypothetical protein [Psychrobacter immobilis]|uniref:hypothetical protein n=1 Tax=Psychrobacter immobilis TaxID=498 RepID=UPI00191B02C4|nr:hypothetical protein [Psychrobacter immobilis]|tara:strand:+ start:724 stop:1317 length:594 start_codon:yes stop_codon:yes gene_type:complete
MGILDSLRLEEDEKYILATENLQALANKHQSSIHSTAVYILINYSSILKTYIDDNIHGYNHVYVKEDGIYRNLAEKDKEAEAQDYLNFYQNAARMHRDERTVSSEFKEKYQNLYLLRELPLPSNSNPQQEEQQGDSLLVLGVVMNSIKDIAGDRYTQELLIDTILDKYKIRGLSKSTLSKKFSEAKKYAKTLVKTES